ncbi:Signal transduction histidine-protein kinase BarA [Ephemeroptericola cinctiostellae]|uniref:histidine kinase n=1 Tax=Ephemeroptericola cinctiostellae TaxID=2268024 RepID=A0A345DCW1_9BURK|nr:hybrid sensor histidine kinase/response regulator [Ephemeroptericola cinctiostellae]AXF86199.1 Signal transduction histidine-protein kinase BarA [Ephemeroptericola cinctiostellae]
MWRTKQTPDTAHNQTESIHLDRISVSGKLRLLDMAYSRLRFGVFSMPYVSIILAWFYQRTNGGDYRVLMWSAAYFIAAITSCFIHQAYRRDAQRLSAELMYLKWLPIVQKSALLHGFGLFILLPLVSQTAIFEFKYIYILTIAAIMAGNATHQAPILSIFKRFFMVGWNGTVLLIPWTLHDAEWPYAMLLSISYSLGMYRHAKISHHFFVRMVWLEEEGARLASNYKDAKEAAEEALKVKNVFLTTASHDLRQPVHAMGFLIESISRRNTDPSLRSSLMDLKQSVHSVTQMFNSLLDLSKIEAGAVQIKNEIIALDPLIEDVVSIFHEEAKSRGLQLRIKSTHNQAAVDADAMLLRQSISNLIHNALRYTKHGGALISARKRNNDWQIEVWDTGIGVAAEDQNNIYSPFFRHQHAWRIDSEGHGLGLAVVARCAGLMGATYGFTSRDGRGSKFWLRLPAVANDTQAALRAQDAHAATYTHAYLHPLSGQCLIVDDDPLVCQAWESLLLSWHVQVRCVASSLQALSAINAGFQPQVILCDQRLRAGESGFDVLRGLLERCPNARGAMISGEFDSPELRQAEHEGYLVLHKPLDPEKLHVLLTRWLSQLDSNQ